MIHAFLLLLTSGCAEADPPTGIAPTEDVTLGGLLVGLDEVTLYDDDGQVRAEGDRYDSPDGYVHLDDAPQGTWYLDATAESGEPVYTPDGRLTFAPLVVDGQAELIEGPFDVPFLDHPVLRLTVGRPASEKAYSTTTSSTPSRLRVTWEASYAMGGDFASGCNSVTSCWKFSSSAAYATGDYASDDSTAWSTMRTAYGTTGNVSCKDSGAASCYVTVNSSTVANYAYQPDTSGTWHYRGGQCKFFQNLVLYRSGIYRYTLPTDSTTAASSSTSASYPLATTANIAVGDALRIPSGGQIHSVIVVVYDSATQKVLVVDSNYTGGAGREAISAHELTFSSTPSTPSYSKWNTYRSLKCIYDASPCHR